jgi:hypothetical protein
MLQGANAALQSNCTPLSIGKSLLVVPLYALILPFTLLLGQQYFMRIMIKICEHCGRLLMRAGINPIREKYVSD